MMSYDLDSAPRKICGEEYINLRTNQLVGFNTMYVANPLQCCRRLVVPDVYLTLDPMHSLIHTTVRAATQRGYFDSPVLPEGYINSDTTIHLSKYGSM